MGNHPYVWAGLVRTRNVLAIAFLVVGTGCGVSSSARGEEACGRDVLADWGKDGRIDRTYRETCYLAAIEALPEDLRAYTSAREDITRALQSAGRGR